MKIRFLGTGAADWKREHKETRSDFRRWSAAIIDDALLIDCNPYVPEALAEYGIAPTEVKYILNTHKHGDHFSQEVVDALTADGAEFVELRAGDAVTLGKYTVYAYAGNHGTCLPTVHFIITDGQHTIFYGLDGAWLLYEEVQGIKKHLPDLAILDATIGFVDGDFRIFEHNNLNMILEMKKTLSRYVKQFCITHMARTLHGSHEEVVQSLQGEGILAAYDGMVIELIDETK